MQETVPQGAPRPLSVIAAEIRRDWRKPFYAAAPYLAAMAQLDHIDGHVGQDDARSVVRYFLANAAGWHGDTARRVKAELRRMVGDA